MSDTPTPQITRCQCGHRYSQHAELGGRCCAPLPSPNKTCKCRAFVPAPSAPARVGEPTFDPTLNCPTHFAQGDPSCASCISKQHPAYIARALAPATAEPTAEPVAWSIGTARGKVLTDLVFPSRSLADDRRKLLDANPFSLDEDVPHQVIPLFRGSGPVGQASEAVDSFWNDKHCAKCGSRFRLNESAHYDGSTFVHFPNCPHDPSAVAASAEAKRGEITDAMVSRAMDCAIECGVFTEKARGEGQALHELRDILRAALSPESGV